METSSGTGQDRASAFPQTHWTSIFETSSSNPDQARAALEKLCALYRQPIVNWFGRHASRQDAEDFAHDFIEYLLAKEVLSELVERRGRFRFFLVTVMRRFLYGAWAKAAAQKRGGSVTMAPLADDEAGQATEQGADSQFDLDLALNIHGRVMNHLAPPTELIEFLRA